MQSQLPKNNDTSERKVSFNRVAQLHDSVRPDYTEELNQDLVEFAGIGKGTRVLGGAESDRRIFPGIQNGPFEGL